MTKVYSITAKLSACSNLTLDFQKCRGSPIEFVFGRIWHPFPLCCLCALAKGLKLKCFYLQEKTSLHLQSSRENYRSTSWRIAHKRLIIRIYFPSQELLEHSTKRVLKKMFNLLRLLIPLGFYIHAPLLHYMYTSICLVLNKEPQQKTTVNFSLGQLCSRVFFSYLFL